jgi:hypothetical protein
MEGGNAISMRAAAELAGVSYFSIRRMALRGDLVAFRVGKRILVDKLALINQIEAAKAVRPRGSRRTTTRGETV